MSGNFNSNSNEPLPQRQSGTPYGNAERRFTVIRVLTDLFINDNGQMGPSERALHEEVLNGMIAESGTTLRTEVAERFAAIRRPPLKVVQVLAREEFTIARHLLLHSPALNDAELIAIAGETTLDHRLAIAQRGEISSAVVDTLIQQEEPCVLMAVARNLGATIGNEALVRMTSWSRRDEELADILIGRDDDDAETISQLFWTADEDTRQQILEKTTIYDNQDGSLKYAPIRVSGLVERRDALEGLAALLTSRRQTEFRHFLAQMLGISQRLASRIASDPGGEPFALACKAADFPGNAFTTLLLLYNPQVSQSVQRVYALSEMYEDISSPVAWHFLEIWNDLDRREPTGAAMDLRPAIHESLTARTGATRVAAVPDQTPVRVSRAPAGKRAVFGRRN